jgi:hypothetical protein
MRRNFSSIKVEAAPGSYLPSFMQDLQELSKCYGCPVVGVFNDREITVGENNKCVYVG